MKKKTKNTYTIEKRFIKENLLAISINSPWYKYTSNDILLIKDKHELPRFILVSKDKIAITMTIEQIILRKILGVPDDLVRIYISMIKKQKEEINKNQLYLRKNFSKAFL